MVAILLAVERFAKFLRVFPAHAFDRKSGTLCIAGIGGHHCFVLRLGHLEFAELKRAGDGYLMRRLFVGVTFSVTSGTAHHEAARRDAYEVHVWPLLRSRLQANLYCELFYCPRYQRSQSLIPGLIG